MAAPLTAQGLQDLTDSLLGEQPSPNSVEIKRLKADLAAATPGTCLLYTSDAADE